jgi:cell division protein ZapD
MTSMPGHELKTDELLSSVRQRSTIPGGTCDFDLPRFNFWLHRDYEYRSIDQRRWYTTLDPVRQTIELLLKMIRGSTDFIERNSIAGTHTEQLEKDTPYQMIRVRLPYSATCFAEISGSRHCFTIRFMEPSDIGRPKNIDNDTIFQLALCRI